MPGRIATKAIVGASKKMPGLRRIPVLKLLAIAEIALLAREHMTKLDRDERRRLIQLVRLGRGRGRNLTATERDELRTLVAKAEPGLFVGVAADKLSPVPIPERMQRILAKRA
jgi:hypothetical protein